MSAHPMSRGSETTGPSPWEDLRPRVYKAIRAAALGPETSEARRKWLERRLSTLFQQDAREITFPEELLEAQQAFFQAGLKRAVNRCRQYAAAWFTWDSLDPEELVREV
ncbi:MAG: hypothetical protein P8168_05365 [Deltaproteobacteria bacterium]